MERKATDQEFIDCWNLNNGEARKVAEVLGMNVRAVYRRRNFIERARGVHLPSGGASKGFNRGDAGIVPFDYKPRLKIDGFSGCAVVFSDAHFWPGISETVAYKGLLKVIRKVKPALVVANGDILDGAKVSRFPPDGWDKRPRMKDELDEVKARMHSIRAISMGAEHIRTIGNHDTRFDRFLSVNAGEFEEIEGFRLKDHLPEWRETISVWVNDNTVIKHRWHAGVHAGWNNVMKSGMTMVTGHTHALEAKPYCDYRGRRWGVQTGTLAEPQGPQFAYAEDNPGQMCSGFVVLTYLPDGRLLQPELAEVIDGQCWFRGSAWA